MPRTVHFATDNDWGKRKDDLGKEVTWAKVVQAGIESLEKGMNTKEAEPEPVGPAYFLLDPEKNVLVREFDMVKDNVWVTTPFDEIPLRARFRVRDDAKVIKTEGHKELMKLGERFVKEGVAYAEVLPK